jgi:hypothetical protein
MYQNIPFETTVSVVVVVVGLLGLFEPYTGRCCY